MSEVLLCLGINAYCQIVGIQSIIDIQTYKKEFNYDAR